MIWFDLDKTLWNSYSTNGKEVFAKNIGIPNYYDPYKTAVYGENGVIRLQRGVHSIIKNISKVHNVGVISLGGLKGIALEDQPSYKALNLFGLLPYFSDIIIGYKDEDKGELLSSHVEYDPYTSHMVIDDDISQLNSLTSRGFKVLDRGDFNSWSEDYDFVLGSVNDAVY